MSILVIGDGIDSASQDANRTSVLARAGAMGLPIYSIAMGNR